jgi:hypothetical protein
MTSRPRRLIADSLFVTLALLVFLTGMPAPAVAADCKDCASQCPSDENWQRCVDACARTCTSSSPTPTPVPVCPPGTQATLQGCETFSCPEGHRVEGNQCVPFTCETGYKVQGNSCVQITCDTGYKLDGNSCVQITCDTGYKLDGNSCVQITCNSDEVLDGNACVPKPVVEGEPIIEPAPQQP